MKRYNLDYSRALKKIQLDSKKFLDETEDTDLPVEEFFTKAKKIQVKVKDWDENSLLYWNKHYISKDTLIKYNVFNVSHVYLDKILSKRATQRNPIYSYHFPSTDRIKIYRPLTKIQADKWISSTKCEDITGWEYYSSRRHSIIFITSSGKDAMVLHSLGFPAIAPVTEKSVVSESVMEYIKTRYRYVFVFMDNDDAGMKANFKYFKSYNIPYVFIPLKYGVKDISDFILKFKRRKTLKLVKKLLKTNLKSSTMFPF